MKYSDEIQQKCGKKITNRTMFLVTLLVIFFFSPKNNYKSKSKDWSEKNDSIILRQKKKNPRTTDWCQKHTNILSWKSSY